MPYQSAKQRGYLHAHPEIKRKGSKQPLADEWDKDYGGKVRKSDGYGSPAAGRRVTDLEEVDKRLGVQPVLARRAPAAGRGGRRIVTGQVRKAYTPSNLKQLKGLAAQADQAAFKTAKPKPYVVKKPPYNVGKAYQASNLKALKSLAAQADQKAFQTAKPKPFQVKKPPYTVSKAGFGGVMRGARNAFGVARGGFKSGLAQSRGLTGAAAKPKMPLGASVAAAKSPALARLGSMSQTMGANPLTTGVVAGAGLGAGGMALSQPRQPKPSIYAPSYGGFGKRSYDPEANRRFREGAYAAGSGAAGLGAGAYAAREARDATRVARSGAPFGPHAGKLKMFELLDASGRTSKYKEVDPRSVKAAQKLKRGVAISRRGALAGVGSLAALGTSGALIRNRNEERWD